MAKPKAPGTKLAKVAPEKVAASIHIRDADKMTAKGRRDIAEWLRSHADFLLENGKDYDARFRGRYIYT
jgi:hypothetical protein